MQKPASSLMAKILCWFFLNMALAAVMLAALFVFQLQANLGALFGQAGANRLRSAAMLIARDLNQTGTNQWAAVLARHADIQQVDFALVFKDGAHYLSKDMALPISVIQQVRHDLRPIHPPDRFPRPRDLDEPRMGSANQFSANAPNRPGNNPSPSRPPDPAKPHLVMKTRNPARYWSGILMPPLSAKGLHASLPAMLVAVSDSVTGNGFFFDPIPWIAIAGAIMLISILLWIPMVRHITRPIARMTHAAERIAKGRFDLSIHENRADEIGRLAKAINHMTTRLSALVKGQKRFLGDVAHELGSPIARIQFGLGALEQRVDEENRQRINEVMDDVDHLSRLVNELLAFSRADLKTKTIQLEKINLYPVVEEAVKREETPAAVFDIKSQPGLFVMASAELLTRALANLLRNAIKYAGQNGPIRIDARKIKNQAEIVVRDCGPGVPEVFLDQLFEPFFRPEPSRDRHAGGVGLGLAIVKTCVESCNGTVSASNIAEGGFAVTITLEAV